MMKKQYVKPELEILETSTEDVLSVSMEDSWTGTGDGDFDLGWFD